MRVYVDPECLMDDLAWWCLPLAVVSPAIATSNFLDQQWIYGAVWVGLCIVFTVLCVMWTHINRDRRVRNGRNRQAEANLDDPGAEGSAGVTSGPFTLGPGPFISFTGYGTGYGPGLAAAADPVTEEQRDDPVKGWKMASVGFYDGRYFFRPLNTGFSSYGAKAKALCNGYGHFRSVTLFTPTSMPAEHGEVPVLGCTCGFYAYSDRGALGEADNPTLATLEVDLYGTVIEHEHGYRASHQQVLSASFPRRCFFCAADPIGLEIVGLGTGDGIARVMPKCETHRETGPLVQPSDLASIMGTEVRWS